MPLGNPTKSNHKRDLRDLFDRLNKHVEILLAEGLSLFSDSRSESNQDAGFFAKMDRTLFEILYRRESLALAKSDPGAVKAVGSLDLILNRYIDYRSLLRVELQKRRMSPDGRRRLYSASRPKSLVVLVTGRCQLHCTYCNIPDYSTDLSAKNARNAVDFLFTSPSTRPMQIHFFGGEPLLRFALIKDMVSWIKARERESEQGILYRLSTNGLLVKNESLDFLLEHDFFLEASCDGDGRTQLSQRRMGRSSSRDYYADFVGRLDLLRKSGLRYHLTMIVLPETAGSLFANFRHLVESGHGRIKVDYAVGAPWTSGQTLTYLEQMSRIAEYAANREGVELLNLKQRHSEPLCLDGDLLTMNWDGRLIAGAAMFLGFPRKIYLRPLDAAPISEHGVTPLDNFWLLSRVNRPGGDKFRRTLLNNIDMGRLVHQWGLAHRSGAAVAPNHDPRPIEIHGVRESENHFALNVLKRPAQEQQTEAVSLFLEGTCDGNCIFCRHIARRPPSLEEVRSRLVGLNGRLVCIIGDEPLAHPDILEIVAYGRDCQAGAVEIMTSGIRLSDKAFAESLIRSGATAFSVPLHAAQADVHDRVTQMPGSFERVTAGLDHASRLGAHLFIHANLLRDNINELENLARLARARWNADFAAIPVRPKTANHPYESLVVRLSEIQRRKIGNLHGFPLCLGASPNVLLSQSLRFYFEAQSFVKPPKCALCRIQDRCPGVFKDYLELYGDGELKPVR